jgi:pimeloyl-ACP methyl ester carboxylesterase
MPRIQTRAGDLFYLQRGQEGPALVCVHGAGGTHAHWGYQLRALSSSTRVYTIDLPGHGRSPLPGRTSIATYASALLHVLDALSLERAVVAGHSMGGAIALWAALEAPERVAGLALFGAGARMRVAPAILDGLLGDRLATIHTIVSYSYPSGTPERMLQRAEISYAGCDPEVYRGDFLACDAFDVQARLGEIACPTAIVCGTDDRMTPPKYAKALCDGIAGATLELLPGVGHMAPIEQPEMVSAALRELLRRS